MSDPVLPQRFLEAASAYTGQALPPVESWHPAFCGDIDMRIARDGRWFYMGTPINRPPLVTLFARILRRDPERYVLVTPVECVGIVVEDAPFLAVEMEEMTGEAGATLAFRTNLDEVIVAGAAHPIRFELDEKGGLKPYIKVRGGLWARLTRALTLDLVERFEQSGESVILSLNGCQFVVPDAVSDPELRD